MPHTSDAKRVSYTPATVGANHFKKMTNLTASLLLCEEYPSLPPRMSEGNITINSLYRFSELFHCKLSSLMSEAGL
jgi:hypothetical protein